MAVSRRVAPIVLGLSLLGAALAPEQAPVTYRLSFPEPEQRWMHVDVTFADLPPSPLEIRMSRSSPGRYALHEFAKNVFDVKVTDGAGRALEAKRPNPHQWSVTGHDGTVRVVYRIFGDRTDGTYLSVDVTHAHLNMPATLMWARGLDDRAVRITFEGLAARFWKVATQLFPTDDPATFTAPNLQYLMDSPAELGTFSLRTFKEGDATFRVTVHHEGTEDEVTAFARDVQTIVREEAAIYGELPPFDGGTYTFLSDYRPGVNGDGMEHRDSTVLTSPASLANDRTGNLDTVAHEFFHSWNVERIRPRSLEPFDFEEANMSGELWLAEGFTSYYDGLVMARTGLETLEATLDRWSDLVDAVVLSPARRFRSAEDMSRLAPFVDAARSIDPTNWDNTFISYYTFGAAIGLALDLSLRELSGGKVTLDDYMRAMWVTFGRPRSHAPGYVDTPYTIDDARRVLGEVAGSTRFADEFFSRYIQGHDVADYKRLLAQAGFVVRPAQPGQSWLGLSRVEEREGGVAILGPVRYETPAYRGGLAEGDVLLSINGRSVTTPEELQHALTAKGPGTEISVALRRAGQPLTRRVTLGEDPRLTIVRAERDVHSLTPAQKQFRAAWLSSKAK